MVRNVGFHGTVNSVQNKGPNDIKEQVMKMIKAAKPNQQAQQGDLVIYRNPVNNDITINRKGVLGDYGTILKDNGSVIKVLAPANGGPKEILPAGTVSPELMKEVIEKNGL